MYSQYSLYLWLCKHGVTSAYSPYPHLYSFPHRVLGQAMLELPNLRTSTSRLHSSKLTTWQSQDQTVALSGAGDVLFALLLSLCRCGNQGRRRRSDRGRLTLHARLSYAIAINVLEIYRYNRFNTLSYLIFCTIVLFTHMKLTSLCSASNRFNVIS